MGIIKFNGVSTENSHITVEKYPNYEIPEKKYDVIEIPGRSDVIIDREGYKDVDRIYDLVFEDYYNPAVHFKDLASMFSNWLMSGKKYQRLEDSYEPDVYFKAYVLGPYAVTNIINKVGRVQVTFKRRAEKYLKTGEVPVKSTANTFVYNPTPNKSQPIIKINTTGKGKLIVGKQTIEIIDDSVRQVIIDSTIKECYLPGVNMNDKIKLKDGFPIFDIGETRILKEGGVTSFEVIPNWWRL